jgi:signal transduction histidine kinase
MNIIANAIDALEEWKSLPAGLTPTIWIRTQVVGSQRQNLATQQQATAYLAEASAIDSQILLQPHVVILIQDNGPGMSEIVQSQLFDPFFTTKPIGKGTGLGLSISHQIVEKHGGFIKCLSHPGQGTAFWIQIPVSPTPLNPLTSSYHTASIVS